MKNVNIIAPGNESHRPVTPNQIGRVAANIIWNNKSKMDKTIAFFVSPAPLIEPIITVIIPRSPKDNAINLMNVAVFAITSSSPGTNIATIISARTKRIIPSIVKNVNERNEAFFRV